MCIGRELMKRDAIFEKGVLGDHRNDQCRALRCWRIFHPYSDGSLDVSQQFEAV